jgi:basic amino acid/polyamine antiporter, APA family
MSTEGGSGQLARRLGLFAATMTGVGVIIGAGIYVLIGVAAEHAGNAVWISFILAAVAAAFTAVSYARLTHRKARNAPEFLFVNIAFGGNLAFLAGWVMLVAQVVSASVVALGFAGYLNYLTGIPVFISAAGLILLCSFVLFAGISQSAWTVGILTVIQVVGLVIVIAIGLPRFGSVNYFEMPSGFGGVFGAAGLVFFAFLGFEGLANIAEEMKNPEKDLPRAIILSLTFATAAYILVAFAAVSTLGWQALSASEAPLADAARLALGENAGAVIAVISLAATSSTTLVMLLAGTRIMLALSCEGALPVAVCRVNRTKTPWLSITIVGVAALAVAAVRAIEGIAQFTNFLTLAAFIGVNASVIRIIKDEKAGPARRVLLNRVLPVLGVLTASGLAVSTGPLAIGLGLAVIAVGLLVRRLTRRKGQVPQSG